MRDKGEYRGIYVALIDSPEFQDLSACGRGCLYALKLKLGQAGIDVFYPETLPRYTGFAAADCESAVEELQSSGWLIVERNVYWLRNGLRFEPSDPLSNGNGRKGISKHLRTLPKLEIVNRFAADYQLDTATPDLIPPSPKASPSEAPSEPLTKSLTKPLRSTEDGRRKTETDTTSLRSVGAEGAAPEAEWAEVIEGDEPLPGGAEVIPLRRPDSAEAVVGSLVPVGSARLSGVQVLAAWLRTQPRTLSRRERERFGGIAKTVADQHTAPEVAAAFVGIGQLAPHCAPFNEPWDLEQLQRKFTRAAAAALNHPALRQQQAEAEFDRILDQRQGGRR